MRASWVGLAAMTLAMLAGCQSPPKAHPRELTLSSPYPDVRTFAVAPAQNLSGMPTVDVLRISDTVFSELQQVEGLEVLPVNKTLQVMQKLNLRRIDSVAAAQRVAGQLGVDALVVPVITEYDPYRPPVVGMVLQLYTPGVPEPAAGPTARDITGSELQPATQAYAAQPVSTVTAVFNASNQSVLRELHAFAEGRTDYGSALQEDQFLDDQDAYVRFVAHAMVARLMEVERARLADR